LQLLVFTGKIRLTFEFAVPGSKVDQARLGNNIHFLRDKKEPL